MAFLIVVFWFLIFVVIYTYAGYGILLSFIVWIKKKILKNGQKVDIAEPNNTPEVTLCIAAYNEEDVINQKLDNCLSLDYSKAKLTILVVSDGSDDNTVDIVKGYIETHSDYRILLDIGDKRGGKSSALTRGMKLVKTPITIFSDANVMLCKESVNHLVKFFSNKQIGCVAGEKHVISNVAKNIDAIVSEGIYWKYESFLKKLDYNLSSVMGADGSLYAIRTKLFKPLSNDVILDDFIISMRILEDGYKIAYCPEAYALEGSSANVKEESKRKVRISAGGLQSVLMLKELLNPFKYGILTFEYVSHRVLRWTVTPVCLFLLLPVNVIVAAIYGMHPLIYPLILALQILFYLLALTGYILSKNGKKSKIPYVCFYFIFMNICVIRGFFYLRNKRGSGTWERAKRA